MPQGMIKPRSRFVIRRYQAVLLILGVFFLGSVSVFSTRGDFKTTRIYTPYRIALTFDDGPHPGYTERLLNILAENHVAATFFVVGSQVERHPDLTRAISWAGHEVANHSYTHPNLTALPLFEAERELNDTRSLVERTINKQTLYFRPPGGRHNRRILEMASQDGYRMILWNVFPQDHNRPAPEKIYQRVMAAAADGGVVLLHSGVEETIRILPQLISDLRAKGFQFLTISEMLEERVDPQTVASWCFPHDRAATVQATRPARAVAGRDSVLPPS